MRLKRFIHWEHRIDEQQHVILAIDYGNQYQDRLTLDQRHIQALDRNQPLSHTYDTKGCRFVGVADYTVSTPRPELGNISLLEYPSLITLGKAKFENLIQLGSRISLAQK